MNPRQTVPAATQEPFAHPSGESAGLGMRLLVSPVAGRLRLLPAARFHEGEEWVSPGQPVAEVEKGEQTVTVHVAREARVAGILVRDGEPVAQGQPLLWLDETPLPASRNGSPRGGR